MTVVSSAAAAKAGGFSPKSAAENARAASSTRPADVGVNVHDTSGTSTEIDSASDGFSIPRTAPMETKAGTLMGSAWIIGRRFIAADLCGCNATIHSYSSGSVAANLMLCTPKLASANDGSSFHADAKGRRVLRFVPPNASKRPRPSEYPAGSPRLGDGTNTDASAIFTVKHPGSNEAAPFTSLDASSSTAVAGGENAAACLAHAAPNRAILAMDSECAPARTCVTLTSTTGCLDPSNASALTLTPTFNNTASFSPGSEDGSTSAVAGLEAGDHTLTFLTANECCADADFALLGTTELCSAVDTSTTATGSPDVSDGPFSRCSNMTTRVVVASANETVTASPSFEEISSGRDMGNGLASAAQSASLVSSLRVPASDSTAFRRK